MTYLLLPAMTLSAGRAILTGMRAVIVHVRVEFDVVEIDRELSVNAKKVQDIRSGVQTTDRGGKTLTRVCWSGLWSFSRKSNQRESYCMRFRLRG